MTPDSVAPSKPDLLQFDKAVDAGAATTGTPAAITCASCGVVITDRYFEANGQVLCSACRLKLEKSEALGRAAARSAGSLLKAVLYGLGAAIAGAVLYYAVIALTGLEIGLVAIVIGFMVGWAVRKAAANRGGRRYQLLAAALTYLAVGLAYSPIAVKEVMKSGASSDSVATAAPDLASARDLPDSIRATARHASSVSATEPVGFLKLAIGLGLIAVFIVALPVVVVVGSMPSGLISALIIGFGILQAWKMNAEVKLAITGPYQLGTTPAAGTPPATAA